MKTAIRATCLAACAAAAAGQSTYCADQAAACNTQTATCSFYCSYDMGQQFHEAVVTANASNCPEMKSTVQSHIDSVTTCPDLNDPAYLALRNCYLGSAVDDVCLKGELTDGSTVAPIIVTPSPGSEPDPSVPAKTPSTPEPSPVPSPEPSSLTTPELESGQGGGGDGSGGSGSNNEQTDSTSPAPESGPQDPAPENVGGQATDTAGVSGLGSVAASVVTALGSMFMLMAVAFDA